MKGFGIARAGAGRSRPACRRGQAMVEYTLAMVIVLTLTSLLALLLYTIRQSGDRVLDLVASEYP